jgi:hypothetical protein
VRVAISIRTVVQMHGDPGKSQSVLPADSLIYRARQEWPGSTVSLTLLFDGGLGGGSDSEFVTGLARIFVQDAQAALAQVGGSGAA